MLFFFTIFAETFHTIQPPNINQHTNMKRAKNLPLLIAILSACTGIYAQDKKIAISSATAGSSEEYYENFASKAIDNNVQTFWHSEYVYSRTQFPVAFTIKLASPTEVDYVRYIPRQDGNTNGHWDEVSVAYSPTVDGSDFTTIGDYRLHGSGSSYDFHMPEQGVECGQIRFTIRSGKADFASAAEIEVYSIDHSKSNLFAPYFADELFTELKPGVTSSNGISDADVKALVDNLLEDADGYQKFRVGEYEAYETPATLQNRLKTKQKYSQYENPTGIYLEAGQSCYVAVSGIGADPVRLKIKNWVENEASSSYPLRNGLNYIEATTGGNVFVDYYTDNFENAPAVELHFINAPVRGYWNQETMTNDDWKELLEGYTSDDNSILMVQSQHAQLAYPVSAWLQHCPTDVNTLMTYYEKVQWAIRDMMGLDKYDKQTKNRQLFFASTYGFMAATEEGAYCHLNSLGDIMTTDAARFGFWAVGHEWGHNNQITPGFNWSGCGETTNNIYASWAEIHARMDFGNSPHGYLRLEDEVIGINDYSNTRGGRMQTYFEEGLRKGIAWQLWDGPDYHGNTPEEKTVMGKDANGNDTEEVTTASRNYDHFVKLAPFWQLNLWGTLANKCPDIITKVIESIRTTENYHSIHNTNGKQQINWMKLACDSAGTDLLPFFEKAGMLRPIHAYIEDYGAGWNIITEEMIAELKAYVRTKGYPAFTEELNYINGHNYPIYRDKLELETPATQGIGCTRNGDRVTVLHEAVKNAVAFETYDATNQLIRITMYGLGSDDAHSYTQVLFPEGEGATYIIAVGYDGTRKAIFATREVLKPQLLELINKTTTLIEQCGTVTNTPTTQDQLALQTTDVNGDNHLSTNADQNVIGNEADGDGIGALIDGSVKTHMHTQWSGDAVNDDHYLQVYFGKGKGLTEFTFTYATRDMYWEETSPAPTRIEVYGSNDGESFTARLATFTKDDILNPLPSYTEPGKFWTSTNITSATPYDYIRIYVRESDGPAKDKEDKYGGHYYFAMSEFCVTAINMGSISVELGNDAGRVTEQQLRDAYSELLSTQSVYDNAYATEEQLQSAIDNLQETYNALNEAYNTPPIDKSELTALIAEVEGIVATCPIEDYTGSLYVTESLLASTQSAIDAAQEIRDDKRATEEEYTTAIANLRTAKEKLQYAIGRAWLPVILTTDIEAPVLYTINSKRTGGKALQYDPADEHTFSIADKAEGSAKQAFFFMEGDAATQVYVYPFAAGEQVLAAEDITDGARKAFAKPRGAMKHEQWSFVKQTDAYNIQPVGTSTCLSHYGNGSNKMGFYSSYSSTDAGSLFTFTTTIVAGSAAYNSLKVYCDEAGKAYGSEITGNDKIGCYPQSAAEAYNTAYTAATTTLLATTATDAEYLAAYRELMAANDALVINMPEEGKYYVIRSAHTGYANGALVYANPTDNKLYWSADKTTDDATAIWTITPIHEGRYHICNLHTGTYINGFISNNPSPLSTTAGEAGLHSLSSDGQLNINCSGTMHAQNTNNKPVVSYSGGAGTASAWYIEEVDITQVKHVCKVGQYRHAGLYLNYPVTIPEGMEAYYIDGRNINIDDDGMGTLTLSLIEGNVLPAKTAVILRAPQDDYILEYTDSDAAVEDNLLQGSAYQTYREAETNHLYYVFGQKDGIVGLYKNSVKYDAEGAEGTTHYKMSANKILFDWDSTASHVTSFRFHIGGDETDIENIATDAPAAIHDLYGRRISEVTASGLYIINGEKHYVRVK